MIYFSSDLHLNHKNIIKYSNRPFQDVQEMNEKLIENHNKIVKQKDTWYFLGDFAMYYNLDRLGDLINRFNGKKYFVLGNHDDYDDLVYLQDKRIIEYVDKTYLISYQKQKIFLSHYSHRVWPKKHYGVWHLFGHSHGTLPPNDLSFDVGVDACNYEPISFDQVSEKMNSFNITLSDLDKSYIERINGET